MKYISTVTDRINLKIINFVLLLLIVLPFLVNSFYSFPSADDFCLASNSMKYDLLEAQMERYQNWTGRYFSSFLLSLNPLVFHSIFIYQVISSLIIIGTLLSFYLLFKTVFIKLSSSSQFALTIITFLLYLFQLPDISQGFYWLPGSVSYQLANIFFLLMVVTTINYYRLGNPIYIISSIILLIFIIGSNETSMLIVDFFVFILFIYDFFILKKRSPFIMALLFIAIACSVIVLLSPGNSIRKEYFPNKHQFYFSIFRSILASIINTLTWLPFILLIIMFISSFAKSVKFQSSLFNVKPVVILLLIVFILFAGFFPAFWSMGISPPPRTINITYFYFILLSFYFAFVINQKLANKNIEFLNFSPMARVGLSFVIALFLLNANNIRTAYGDLFLGRSAAFYNTLKHRHEIILASTKDTIFVPPLAAQPKTIFFEDITTDGNFWQNRCMANYYNVSHIVVEK